MISGIITIVVISILFGTLSPISSPGVNFPLETGKKLYSQITSQVQKKSLSEVNPLESLDGVTTPLDNVFKAIGDRLGGLDGIKGFLGGSSNSALSGRVKSSLLGSFDSGDTSGTSWMMEMLKSGFVLVAKIFLAVLQVVTSIIKTILGPIA